MKRIKMEQLKKGISRHKRLSFACAIAIWLLVIILSVLLTDRTGGAFIILAAIELAVTIIMIFIGANLLMKNKIYAQRKPFDTFSGIRNVDTLYIGEISRGGAHDNNILYIYTPNATENSAYEVLRHTFSILDENGSTVVLCVNASAQRNKKSFSVFDIPFFNDVTIHRLGLENIKSEIWFPLLYDLAGCFRYIFKIGKKAKEEQCVNDEILDFCEQRNIKLIYLVTC